MEVYLLTVIFIPECEAPIFSMNLHVNEVLKKLKIEQRKGGLGNPQLLTAA
jgi:hypothetical protein